MNNCSNHALAFDLLRISILAKDTFDFHKLSNAFGFQVIEFTTVFYFISLEFHGTCTMTEIAQIKLPKSINELSSFLSQKKKNPFIAFCLPSIWFNYNIASD